jgi:hypothetical protein
MSSESAEPLIGRLGAQLVYTAKAARISRSAAKSGGAGEWDGWGQVSDDGKGQYNPSRSEGPWGKAARPLERWCIGAPCSWAVVKKVVFDDVQVSARNSTIPSRMGGKPEKSFELMRPTGAVE